jgi:hypothetical protein
MWAKEAHERRRDALGGQKAPPEFRLSRFLRLI